VFPVKPAIVAQNPRHGANDAAPASGGPDRLRPCRAQGQPKRQTLCQKGQGGDIEQAYGFDLSPLLARAQEFENWLKR
jgi:hypothetical protein